MPPLGQAPGVRYPSTTPGTSYAPGPLGRLHARYGIRGTDGEAAEPPARELAGAR